MLSGEGGKYLLSLSCHCIESCDEQAMKESASMCATTSDLGPTVKRAGSPFDSLLFFPILQNVIHGPLIAARSCFPISSSQLPLVEPSFKIKAAQHVFESEMIGTQLKNMLKAGCESNSRQMNAGENWPGSEIEKERRDETPEWDSRRETHDWHTDAGNRNTD